MRTSDKPAIYLLLSTMFSRVNNSRVPHDVVLHIMKLSEGVFWGAGRSSYARRRRAKAISRCHRCYRVLPKMYCNTRCNGTTCIAAISHNQKVEAFIKWGSNCGDSSY